MNLFEEAINKDELLKFALGKDEYFLADRDYGDHSIINSWISFIIPLIEKKGLAYTNVYIEKMFQSLINSDIDIQTKNESLLYHLHIYYYLDNENRLKAEKLERLNSALLSSLGEYITFLRSKNDTKENAIVGAINLIKTRGGLFLHSI